MFWEWKVQASSSKNENSKAGGSKQQHWKGSLGQHDDLACKSKEFDLYHADRGGNTRRRCIEGSVIRSNFEKN